MKILYQYSSLKSAKVSSRLDSCWELNVAFCPLQNLNYLTIKYENWKLEIENIDMKVQVTTA